MKDNLTYTHTNMEYLNTTHPWSYDTTTDDPTSYMTENYNTSMYNLTTSLLDTFNISPTSDVVTTLSSVLPTSDPFTLLGSEDSLNSTLAGSLLSAASFTK